LGICRTIPQRSKEPPANILNRWKRDGTSAWIPYILFYTVLANLPFWAASRWLAISPNGWFCLDYIAIGLVALYLPRFVGSALLLLAIAVDLVAGVCETYFLPVSQCFTNLGAMRQFSASRLTAVTAVLILILLAGAAGLFLPAIVPKKHRIRSAAWLLLFAIVSLSIDSAILWLRTGSIPGFLVPGRSFQSAVEASYLPDLHFSRLPAFRLIRRKLYPAPNGLPMRNATALALSAAGNIAAKNRQELPNLVVILVESWGLDTESAVSDALIRPYSDPQLRARYQVLQGEVPFAGPTLGGESRELCGSTMAFDVEIASAKELQACLPDRLAARGYHAVAIHGMWAEMFDRVKWYKTMGFQETWFLGQFKDQGLPTCNGAFWGICDAAIADWMGQRLEKSKPDPEFLYWVTLNSHLPVLVPNPLKSPADCSFTPSLAQQPSLCSWYQLIANVHHSAAVLAMSNLARPTIFVIVGDHAPPFSDPFLRDKFSQSLVPYVILVPRRQQPK
jgi:hypothetical protein